MRRLPILPDLIIVVASEEEQHTTFGQSGAKWHVGTIYLCQKMERHSAGRAWPIVLYGKPGKAAELAVGTRTGMGWIGPVQQHCFTAVSVE
jgi:hypothetical protein